MSSIASNRKLWLTVSLLGILIICLKFTSGLEKVIDIRLWDETGYLINGINFFKIKPDPGWGPIYSLWYFFLSMFTKNNIDLYYLNYKLTTILPCMMLFLFLYRLKISPAISYYISSAFLFSLMNLPVWPRISHFCVTVILAGLILIMNLKDKDKKLISALFLSLLCTFIRPEFLISFFILLLFTNYRVFRNTKVIGYFIFVIILSVSLIIILGFPYSTDRNLTAFGQAFDKDFSVGQRMNANGVIGWQQIMKEHFGDVKSVQGAFIDNPKDFIHHLAVNFSRNKQLAYTVAETLIPANIFRLNYIIILLFLLLIPIVILVKLLSDKQGVIINEYISSLSKNKHLFILTIVLTIPVLAEILIYFPRSHYVLLLFPAFYLVIGFLLFPFTIKSIQLNGVVILLLIILSLLFIPSLNNYFIPVASANFKFVGDINRLKITKDVNFLENEGGYSVYLGNNFKTVTPEGIGNNFPTFILNKNVNLIYPTHNLAEVLSPGADSSYYYFLNNYETFNFRKIVIGSGNYILINNELFK